MKSCASQKSQEELVPISSHLVFVDVGIDFQVFLFIHQIFPYHLPGTQHYSLVHETDNIPIFMEFTFWVTGRQKTRKWSPIWFLKRNERNKQSDYRE